jgi:hypothetical protein
MLKQQRPGVGDTALSQNSIGLSRVNAVVGSPELISSQSGTLPIVDSDSNMLDLQLKPYLVKWAFQHLQLYLSFSLQSILNTNDETIAKELENVPYFVSWAF